MGRKLPQGMEKNFFFAVVDVRSYALVFSFRISDIETLNQVVLLFIPCYYIQLHLQVPFIEFHFFVEEKVHNFSILPFKLIFKSHSVEKTFFLFEQPNYEGIHTIIIYYPTVLHRLVQYFTVTRLFFSIHVVVLYLCSTFNFLFLKVKRKKTQHLSYGCIQHRHWSLLCTIMLENRTKGRWFTGHT